MERIGVVGLGAMGLGIAQLYSQAGHPVVATDAQPGARETAHQRIRASLTPRVEAGKMAAADLDALLSRLTVVGTADEVAAADLVIEAVLEDLAVKRALFARLEAAAGPGTILATNTSALSVAAIADGLKRPGRMIGLHFFNPAPVMRLVELVAPPGVDPEALATARRVTEGAGKTVIACADRPGFVVNRCARPFYGEALAMMEEGRSASDIDAAMLAAGYRLGPFSLIDLVGADVNLAATEGLARVMDFNPRYHVFDALKAQVARGDLGRKTGRGFLYPATPGPAPADAAAIVLRIESALANEAASLLAEGAVSETDIDTALKLGLNFPRGAFGAARAQGLDRVRAELRRLAASAPKGLVGRYELQAPLAAMV